MSDPNQADNGLTGLVMYLTDGTQYRCVMAMPWIAICHGIIRDGFFSTDDFFVNRDNIFKINRVDPRELGVNPAQVGASQTPAPPASVVRPTFGVVEGGKESPAVDQDVDAEDLLARVERAAEILYAQAGHFAPWDKADPGVKDHFRDQAARRIAPLAEDPPPVS